MIGDYNIWDFVRIGDKICQLTPEVYTECLKTSFENVDSVLLDIDMFSKIGFNVTIVDGISTYLIRYEDLMLTPTFDPDTENITGFAVLSGIHYNTFTGKPEMLVVDFIPPVKCLHQVQQLLRLGCMAEVANNINTTKL